MIDGKTLAVSGAVCSVWPKIAKNAEIKLKSAVLGALEIPFNAENVEQTFANNVKSAVSGEVTYYISANGDFALPYEGAGLWGPIKGIIAMHPDLESISGLTIMQQEETPGLGSRIADADYLAAFVGKRFTPTLDLVSPGKGGGDNQIDSISGATMSSKAFIEILNSERERYRVAFGGK